MVMTKPDDQFDEELIGANIQIALMRRKLDALDTLFGDSPEYGSVIRDLRDQLNALEALWRNR